MNLPHNRKLREWSSWWMSSIHAVRELVAATSRMHEKLQLITSMNRTPKDVDDCIRCASANGKTDTKSNFILPRIYTVIHQHVNDMSLPILDSSQRCIRCSIALRTKLSLTSPPLTRVYRCLHTARLQTRLAPFSAQCSGEAITQRLLQRRICDSRQQSWLAAASSYGDYIGYDW
ncbi:uncharacterized protein BJ212DRAFT_1577426 [Suillus subaureus]|uniref:Uncharacterized protein n=1 Tax=Suillus subaureus TaxID=48587 RepID=A0A9P7EAU7_9AGAM|nr:uncharacterized protein BJ212DRAFT_1577426 [Suillus subaureus]KAG1815599.1 hypothetical protein BJ212DRAFT_1577426 [Suillus subaureus]